MGTREDLRESVESRERMTEPQRLRAARRLQMSRGHDRHLAARLADAHDVTARWMRAIRLRLERGQEPKARGRPRIPDAERARVKALVRAKLERLGFTTGPLPILAAIRREEPKASAMLVQQATAELPREARARIGREIEERREGHEVLARDAVWCEDTTHLGRLADSEEVSGEMITDRGPLSTVSLSVGAAPAALDVIEDLERAAERRGGWPLVLQHDRGSIYFAQDVKDRLALRMTVALVSRVHTPTDNPLAERANREIKEESGLGKGVVLPDDAAAASRLDRAEARIRLRPRPTRAWRTADELDREMPRADALVDRKAFYEAARSAMRDGVLGLTDEEQIQKAEQDAIWRTLEKHGLARLHIGPRRAPRRMAAPVAAGAAG